MTGRGRAHKTKADSAAPPRPTTCEKTKKASLLTCQGKTLTEEKQNGAKKITAKKDKKESLATDEDKPSSGRQPAGSKKTAQHVSASGRLPGTPDDDHTEASAQAETQKASSAGSMENLGITTRKKPICKKAKPLDQYSGKTSKSEQEPDSGTTDEPVKISRAKKLSSAKAKSTDATTETQVAPAKASLVKHAPASDEKPLQQAANARGNQGTKSKGEKTPKTNPDEILKTTLSKLIIKRDDKSDASKVVNTMIDKIKDHLKKNSQSFREMEEPLRTGSYYENLKISHPDEFDVMMPMPVDRVAIEPFKDDGAFYSVGLKRNNKTLLRFQHEDILSASEMLQEFRDEVKKCMKDEVKKGIQPEWTLTKKKPGCPAVTMTTEVNGTEISLDVVLCIKVKSDWPAFTKDGLKIEKWLGTKVRQQYRYEPYYLVPKYEGKGTEVKDDVLTKDVWRISFSHIEKSIMSNHGEKKTCCEKRGDDCCRKQCLKLLKHLLSLLKASEPAFFNKFYSYHAKTTLLHACCARPADSEWASSDLNGCFQKLLQDFEGHLEKGQLSNFFIPAQNLLARVSQKDCLRLAQRIRQEREQGFPIFK